MAYEDHDFQEEADRLEKSVESLEEKLADLLAPRDEQDSEDIIMEIKAGAGGEEAALFAGDLARMYERYADKTGFNWEVLGLNESDLGGVKDMTISFRSKSPSRDGAWSVFKFEGGVHRVQRVPVTESQGRIQTSAAGVLVYPEPEEVESVNIDDKDIRVDVYRSSGKGGQGVNTTDSAVRITHLPTGLIVTCQKERSQIQNKARALQVLQARLDQMEREAREAEAGEQRASQVRTMDRSERVRTYNWPENRITDHRIGYKANNLDSVLNGDMQDLIKALQDQERAERLASHAEEAGVRTRVVDFQDRAAALADVDLAISATGAEGFTITAGDIPPAHPLMLIDLSLPRDIDDEATKIDDVDLVNIERLSKSLSAAATDVAAGTSPHAQARRIVDEELAAYTSAQRVRDVVPAVSALHRRAADLVECEAARLQHKHPEISGKQLEDVQRALKRVADKLLHEPTVRAKKLAASESSVSSENALQELFGLQLEGSGVSVAVNELPTMTKEA